MTPFLPRSLGRLFLHRLEIAWGYSGHALPVWTANFRLLLELNDSVPQINRCLQGPQILDLFEYYTTGRDFARLTTCYLPS
jgi:hypothetical protein